MACYMALLSWLIHEYNQTVEVEIGTSGMRHILKLVKPRVYLELNILKGAIEKANVEGMNMEEGT